MYLALHIIAFTGAQLQCTYLSHTPQGNRGRRFLSVRQLCELLPLHIAVLLRSTPLIKIAVYFLRALQIAPKDLHVLTACIRSRAYVQ